MCQTRPVVNLSDLVRTAAERRPGRPALVCAGEVLTWSAYDRRVEIAAAALRALGGEAGDRVALALPNGLDLAVLLMATVRADRVVVPLDPASTDRELAHPLADGGVRVLVTSPERIASGAPPGLDHALTPADLTSSEPGGAVAGPGDAQPDRVPSVRGDGDLAALLYTSGTSGRPRGAMLTHAALVANLDQLGAVVPPLLGPADVLLLAVPLFHAYGLGPGLGMVARHGCTGVLLDRPDPAYALQLARVHGATVVSAAPQLYVAWSERDDLVDGLATVRIMTSGAAPLPVAAQRRLAAATGAPVYEGYGLTETAPVLTSTVRSDEVKPQSVGRPLPGVELRLLDVVSGVDVTPAAGGRRGRPRREGSDPRRARRDRRDRLELHELDDDPTDDTRRDEPGEITVRGANLFGGYWPDGREGPDADGWWRTGDVGYLDDDGDLFLVDRLRELVLVSGFNVYPSEVEEVLLTHPAVLAAAAIGVPHPATGETVRAYVVLRPGAILMPEDVIGHCARSLARFKCPTEVEFVAELPRSATGKVRRSALREGIA